MRLPSAAPAAIFDAMFVVTEADAAAIRAAYDQGGELSAVVELRRLFPGLANNENARTCATAPVETARFGFLAKHDWTRR
jgi:hypothetical protein